MDTRFRGYDEFTGLATVLFACSLILGVNIMSATHFMEAAVGDALFMAQ